MIGAMSDQAQMESGEGSGGERGSGQHDSGQGVGEGGGSIDVRLQIAAEIEQALGGGPVIAVATVTSPGEGSGRRAGARLLIRGDGSSLGAIDGGAIDDLVREAASEQLNALPRVAVSTLWVSAARGAIDRRSRAAASDAQVLVEVFESPAKLVIVGGGHIGLVLAQIGEIAGFEIVVLDDREEFANRERFPMAEQVIASDPGVGLDGLALDGSSYVVLVSRGHLLDEEALRHCVGRGAAYVGMIGSRRRTHTVLQSLLDDGFDRRALEAVHTPIGIDIGAETPEEIALSIVAELILERRGGEGGRMAAQRPPLRGS